MKSYLFCFLVWFSLGWVGAVCFGQTVTIRVIDSAKGLPLQKQQVSVSLLYEKGQQAPAKSDRVVHLETDAKGEAHVKLPEPAPGYLGAEVLLTSERWRCGCTALVRTEDVIQHGFVGPGTGRLSAVSMPLVRQKPGEILFLAQPLTFFERLLRPIVKE